MNLSDNLLSNLSAKTPCESDNDNSSQRRQSNSTFGLVVDDGYIADVPTTEAQQNYNYHSPLAARPFDKFVAPSLVDEADAEVDLIMAGTYKPHIDMAVEQVEESAHVAHLGHFARECETIQEESQSNIVSEDLLSGLLTPTGQNAASTHRYQTEIPKLRLAEIGQRSARVQD